MCKKLNSLQQGRGKDLVLLHGWGVNSGIWQPVAERLQQHFRVSYIDLPGYGQNAQIYPTRYTLQSITAAVASVLPKSATVLGWSLGGLIARQLAVDHPSQVDRVITVASSPKFLQSDNWPGIAADVLHRFNAELVNDFSKTIDRFLAIQAMGSVTAKADLKIIRDAVKGVAPPADVALSAGLDILQTADLRSSAPKIKQPTLHVFGHLDSLVPHAVIPKIMGGEETASCHVFRHASHAPFISDPDKFTSLVMDWINKSEHSAYN